MVRTECEHESLARCRGVYHLPGYGLRPQSGARHGESEGRMLITDSRLSV